MKWLDECPTRRRDGAMADVQEHQGSGVAADRPPYMYVYGWGYDIGRGSGTQTDACI